VGGDFFFLESPLPADRELVQFSLDDEYYLLPFLAFLYIIRGGKKKKKEDETLLDR
jgi:hypothetical protein